MLLQLLFAGRRLLLKVKYKTKFFSSFHVRVYSVLGQLISLSIWVHKLLFAHTDQYQWAPPTNVLPIFTRHDRLNSELRLSSLLRESYCSTSVLDGVALPSPPNHCCNYRGDRLFYNHGHALSLICKLLVWSLMLPWWQIIHFWFTDYILFINPMTKTLTLLLDAKM